VEQSIKHLDFFINHIRKTRAYLDDFELNYVQLFSIGLLERLQYSSSSIKLALQNINTNSELEFAAGLSIRAILLDSLLVLQLYKLWKEGEENKKTQNEMEEAAQNFCKNKLADGLKTTINFFELSRELNFIDDTLLGELYKQIVLKYPNHFTSNKETSGKPEVNFKHVTTRDLFKELAESKHTKEMSNIHQQYLFYSQYDHFGVQYFDVINLPKDRKISQINECIKVFIIHQYLLYFFLMQFSNNNSFILGQFEESKKYRNSYSS